MARTSHILLAALMVLSLLQAGCGRKAWPKAAEPGNQMTVSELKAYWQGEDGVIEGVLARTEEDKAVGLVLSGFRIYHTAFPLSAEPCESCPIHYTDVSNLKIEADERGRFLIELGGLGRGDVHFFQLRALGGDGSIGPHSARVKLIRAGN